MSPMRFLDVVYAADGAAAGAPALVQAAQVAAAPVAAPTPAASTPAQAAPAADPAAPAATPAAAPVAPVTPPAGDPPKPYIPDGIPEALRGKDERETLDNIAKDMADRPKPPAKPADYAFEPSDAFKQRYGDGKDDPVLGLWGEVAHEVGLTNDQYSKGVALLYDKMAAKGMIDDAVDVTAELKLLEPTAGDAAQKRAAAETRVNAAVDWVKAQRTRTAISDAEAAKLINLATDAVGVQLIEKLQKLGGEHGLQGGTPANGGGGQPANDEAVRLAKFYPTMVPKSA